MLEVVSCLVDRTFFLGTPEFTDVLSALPFSSWDFNEEHGTTAIRGWRENVWRCSMQIVEHSTGLIEIDFDLFNPDWGALPALLHGIECLWPGKTDSIKVMKGLRKRGFDPVEA